MKRRNLLKTGAAMAVLSAAHQTFAEPSKGVIRFICPFSAGALHDYMTRQIADGVGKVLSRPAIVENRTGAGGLVAVRSLQNVGDNVTTVMQTYPGIVSLPMTLRSARFDPIEDLTPICAFGQSNAVLLVHSSVQATTVKELIDQMRRMPNGIEAATVGVGTFSDVWTAVFARRTDAPVLRVPYRGAAEMTLALQSGEARMLISAYGEQLHSLVQAGTIRLLAVASESPSPMFPGVPTLNQSIPGLVIDPNWYGLQGPKNMPRAEAESIAAAVKKVVADRSMQQKLAAVYVDARFQDKEAFARSMTKSQDIWRELMRELDFKPQ